MKNSTITILIAKSDWSAKSWENPNISEEWPRNSRTDSSKFEKFRENDFPENLNLVFKIFYYYFRYAKYLEVLSLPDDMRELLDEYLDANSRADQQKECAEFFQCPYSIKDSVKRNFDGNSL